MKTVLQYYPLSSSLIDAVKSITRPALQWLKASIPFIQVNKFLFTASLLGDFSVSGGTIKGNDFQGYRDCYYAVKCDASSD
ncbi:MAG: hypothetical protein IPP79_23745 [Chitinophagaceae bacterium]|nr:hypothetical protein [Chitinophagaceae bacterium]